MTALETFTVVCEAHLPALYANESSVSELMARGRAMRNKKPNHAPSDGRVPRSSEELTVYHMAICRRATVCVSCFAGREGKQTTESNAHVFGGSRNV